MANREKAILNRLEEEEISALAYGFPLLPENYYGFNDLSSTGTIDDINGAWKPLEVMDSFDGFDFVDDDFDNFLTKKARERNKRRRELRKEGASRKEARKQAKEEIPKDKLKDIAKKIGGGVGRAVVVGAVAVPRSSFLSLVSINYRGLAYRLSAIIEQKSGNTKSSLNSLKRKWYKLGGKWDKLVDATNKGKNKKPSICGKKCKEKLAEKGLKRGFVNFNQELDFEVYFNFVGTGIGEVAVGTWIALGSSVITAMGSVIGVAVVNKTEREAIEQADKQAELEAKTISESDQKAYEIEMARLKASADPKNAILNSSELSEAEKREALKTLDEAQGISNKNRIVKYALIGGLILGALYFGSKIIKRN